MIWESLPWHMEHLVLLQYDFRFLLLKGIKCTAFTLHLSQHSAESQVKG